ncbi:CBS domain-containing protein [Sporosarcina pasteurii]|uniref:Hypoxic response protein 1 n=2 Tax=Sporosarcina pasteurii TaxID=1474 RepID=A0A380BC62_SPOPA|nr:CBS domain-containing protein [Sporosarcina pasteurii]SUI98366.1 Hypoxic response protein 1 [Sporosarcina pasteurii]
MRENERVALYQKIHDHPLFKGTSESEFITFMTDCQLKHYQQSEKIVYFKTPNEGLFLVLEGKAEVFIESEKGLSVLLEVLQEDEIIGFSHIAHYLNQSVYPILKHRLDLEIVENSYCLQIPASVVKARLKDDAVREYVLKEIALRLGSVYASLGEQVKLGDEWGKSEPFVRRAIDLMSSPAITVQLTDSVKDIANVMIKNSISSVMVVDQNEQLVGIITEKDLVERVLGQGLPNSLCAVDIMTLKPFIASPHDHYYEILSIFYKNGIKHLPVVDGHALIGVITFQNLISKRDRGAMGILKTIEESSFDNLPVVKEAIYDVLTSLIGDEISTIHTLEIITKLYDRLARHCVKLAVQSLDKKGFGLPPVAFSWYQMGSGARGEQFMLTDQDHFLVYADITDVQKKTLVEDYFSLLGEEIVQHLEQVGYARCEGKMMANEEIWRGSISEWQQRLQEWSIKATDEHILLGYNFLSFRFLFGNVSLNKAFITMVQSQLKNAQTFLYYMAQQEQNKPIPQFEQSLFSLFKTRGRLDRIDIKLHALFPMHHCLQILGVLKNLTNQTPLQLLDGLVQTGEFSVGFANDIRHAYEVALKARIQLSWKKHLRGEMSSTEIKFDSIRRWERDELKTMLKTVQSLQAHLLAKL